MYFAVGQSISSKDNPHTAKISQKSSYVKFNGTPTMEILRKPKLEQCFESQNKKQEIQCCPSFQ